MGLWGSSSKLKRGHYMQKKSVYDPLFSPKVWLDLTSSKTTIERLSPSIWSVMVIWKPIFFFWLLLKNTIWRICAFNKTVLYATQLEQICLYCRRHLWPRNFSSQRYQLVIKIMRFDTIRLCFLWGYAKDFVYADKPSTREHLKINIRQVMAGIPSNMCKKWSKITFKESMLATLRVEVI